MKITQFLKEDNGNYSAARLFSLLTVCCFIGDWITHIVRGLDFDPSLTIVGVVLGVVGSKVTQKVFEVKNGVQNSVDIDLSKQ